MHVCIKSNRLDRKYKRCPLICTIQRLIREAHHKLYKLEHKKRQSSETFLIEST